MKLKGPLSFLLLGFAASSSIIESDIERTTQLLPGLFAQLPSELFKQILEPVYPAEKMVLKQTCLFFDEYLRQDVRMRFQEVVVKDNQLPFWQLSLYKVFKEWIECENNGEDASRLLAILKRHHHYPLLERIASGSPVFPANKRFSLNAHTSFDAWLHKHGAQVDVY